MTLWYAWLRICPYAWRDALVPGWKELRLFVDEWMQAAPDMIGRAAYAPKKDHLVGDDEELVVPPDLVDETATVMMSAPSVPPLTMPSRAGVAYRHLGGNGNGPLRLRVVLQRIGSFSKAMQLVHRDRPLTDAERKSFASHACPAEDVTWQYIASGTVAALSALYMMPLDVSE